MPKTLQPLFGLEPWSGIRNPDSIPYYMKRGIASLLWKESDGAPKPYSAKIMSEDFTRAYKIIGASLVRSGNLSKPSTKDGLVELTAKGKKRERELKMSRTKVAREHLKRARSAMKWLDATLSRLKTDLDSRVIEERTL